MRVLEITGVSALAPVLIDSNLLGMGAIKYGSPDLVLISSGGLTCHLNQIQFFVARVILELSLSN